MCVCDLEQNIMQDEELGGAGKLKLQSHYSGVRLDFGLRLGDFGLVYIRGILSHCKESDPKSPKRSPKSQRTPE